MDDDLVLRWMTEETEDDTWEEVDKIEMGKVCFYDNGFVYPPTKTWAFNDAHLVNYKEVFKAEGQDPMQTIITISPAIQDYGACFLKRWNVSHVPTSEKEPYQSIEHEQQIDLKFIAKFERLKSYK